MSLLMLLCPLGMAAMGGVAWVLTRLPGKRTGRIAGGAIDLHAGGAPQSQPADEGPGRTGSLSDA